jgi:hypothetical protein
VFFVFALFQAFPPPPFFYAVSIYFCFSSVKALGFQILGKMNVGFSFKNIILFALVSRLGGIFVSLSWNGSRKLYALLEVRQILIR